MGRRIVCGLSAGGLTTLLLSAPAEAHIKWFEPYDVPAQPRVLSSVLSSVYFELVLAAVLLLTVLTLIERTAFGQSLAAGLDRLSGGIRNRTEDLYRGGTAVFFVSLFTLGDIIMTPELITHVGAIKWIDAAIALGMFWRPTLLLSALGIAGLYVYGVVEYGIYHMLDYPIFLGLAGYLALTSVNMRIGSFRPIDVARWAAAVTLMWASVEKWAYPEWTYPLLNANPGFTLGFSNQFYMVSAGFMEFSLGFALLWTPLVRLLAAALLSAMFISAVLQFGKIDAIGHSMIVVMLLTVGADQAFTPRRAALAPFCYCGALVITLAAYYGLHALIYGTRIW